MKTLKVATFNVENLDLAKDPEKDATIEERIAVLRPMLVRFEDADVLCLQEVHAQGRPRQLKALDKLLEGTPFADYNRFATSGKNGSPFMHQRNLVTLTHFDIIEAHQMLHDIVPAPGYRPVTPIPRPGKAKPLRWERPFLYTKIQLPKGKVLHLINVHFKSKLPTSIPGQMVDRFTWKSGAAAAEGSLMSTIKRLGQAVEVRFLIDKIFEEDADAMIVVTGDFNADTHEETVKAIMAPTEETSNPALKKFRMYAAEAAVAPGKRWTIKHYGEGRMFDHMLHSHAMLKGFRGTEIHNETITDESRAFYTEKRYPEPDHAPVVAEFDLDKLVR